MKITDYVDNQFVENRYPSNPNFKSSLLDLNFFFSDLTADSKPLAHYSLYRYENTRIYLRTLYHKYFTDSQSFGIRALYFDKELVGVTRFEKNASNPADLKVIKHDLFIVSEEKYNAARACLKTETKIDGQLFEFQKADLDQDLDALNSFNGKNLISWFARGDYTLTIARK